MCGFRSVPHVSHSFIHSSDIFMSLLCAGDYASYWEYGGETETKFQFLGIYSLSGHISNKRLVNGKFVAHSRSLIISFCLCYSGLCRVIGWVR